MEVSSYRKTHNRQDNFSAECGKYAIQRVMLSWLEVMREIELVIDGKLSRRIDLQDWAS